MTTWKRLFRLLRIHRETLLLLLLLQFSLISCQHSTGPPTLRSFEPSPEDKRKIKQKLLSEVGLLSRPPINRPTVPVPDYLWEIYKQLSESGGRGVVRAFFPDDFPATTDSWTELVFNMTHGFREDENITNADLMLRLRHKWDDNVTDADLIRRLRDKWKNKVRISVYQVLKDSNRSLLLDSQIIPQGPDRLALDVFPAVQRASSFTEKTLKLSIQIRSSSGQELELDSRDQFRPALLLYEGHAVARLSQTWGLDSRTLLLRSLARDYLTRGRIKRGAKRQKQRKNRRRGGRRRKLRQRANLCRRHRVYIDFRELNWQDWIMAPSGYWAYYCTGLCIYPLVEAQNTTNHAVIQALVNSVSPGATPPPCCVPTEMSQISLLYTDIDNRVVIKTYPDMVVEGCGCR